jgi:hypothetical protein
LVVVVVVVLVVAAAAVVMCVSAFPASPSLSDKSSEKLRHRGKRRGRGEANRLTHD